MALAKRMDAIESRVLAAETEQMQIRQEWNVIQQAPFINGRLLRSLRETQIEHSRKLGEHERRFDEHDRRFDAHDRRFDDVDRQLGELRQGMGAVVGMLTTLIERDEGDR